MFKNSTGQCEVASASRNDMHGNVARVEEVE